MPIPEIFCKQVDKSGALVDSTLIKWVRHQHRIQITGLQQGNAVRRWNSTDLNFRVGINAAFSQVVAQKQIVHREREGNTDNKALEILGFFHLACMALGHGDGLTVDVLNAGQLHTERSCPQAQGHGNGHGGEHVISIQFASNGRVAHGAPARHLHQLHIEAIAVVEAHRLGHDDRRSAGDWNKSHLQRRLLKITHLHRGITAGLFALGPTVGQGNQGGTRS